MNEQAFTILEYGPALALVRREARTESGRASFDELAPYADEAALRRALRAVREARDFKQRQGALWFFAQLPDPTETLAHLRIGGASLPARALLELARLAEQAVAARLLLGPEREACPTLWDAVAPVPTDLRQTAARVTAKILPGGELDDRASPELARLRSELNKLRHRLTRSLEALMRRAGEAIQDNLVTVRNERFVVPVKADLRSRVPGVVHGQSSSGATMFVEPLEAIEGNNELQALRETEQREIQRILFALTEELRAVRPALEAAARAVAELDFVGAKVRFGDTFNCCVPQIDEGRALELTHARHPLLEENLRQDARAVVPVSFALDAEQNAMVISGANAGGKTVVLKTAGLLSLLALSGLPVPAAAARVPFYRSVLADIGDHQSLAANLSTFTSHVANIAQMIELCDPPALVLLDEVGTGTDPEEGSALGVAAVDYFRRVLGAHVMVSTHYGGLKMYAANETGVLNASVEFDEKTLQPTYRLLTGLAGASSGLEIARRFGMPEVVINAARTHVSASSREAAEYLARIKRESDAAEDLRRALEEERAAVAERYAQLDVEAHRRERQRQQDFEKDLLAALAEFEQRGQAHVAKIEDRALRERAAREAQRRVAELKTEVQKQARAATLAHTPVAARARVARDGQVLQKQEEKPAPVAPPRPVVKGDKVRLTTFGSTGLVEKISGDTAEILVGSMRLREKLKNLELLAPEPDTPAQGFLAALQTKPRAHVKTSGAAPRTELNLIGQTVADALDETDKFLDEAYVNGAFNLRIIHGFGTGALRRAVHDFLRQHTHVARYAPAPDNQGGNGATLVELKR
jgi:DNA mismatch repair protein MutS2